MALRISYFAWVREAVGIAGEDAPVPATARTIGDVVAWLHARGGHGAAAFADAHRLRAALDNHMATMDTPIAGAQELALFPPVTGG
ncbi:MAG: MoaD/ThiS family protein [Sphingopyxis sp.]